MAAVLGTLGELGYGYAYRVLDAQHFGVPQRRRRLYFVGHLGAPWSAPGAVLLEPEGGAGHPAPGGEAGAIAASRIARSLGGVGGGQDYGANKGTLILPTLTAAMGHDAGAAGQSGKDEIVLGVAHATLITLQDTSGRDKDQHGLGVSEAAVAYTVDTLGTAGVAQPLRSRPYSDSGGAEGGLLALTEGAHGVTENSTTDPLQVGGGKPGQGYQAIREGMAVRRLTPLECERLQGFPDGWTDGQSDSARYRQLGNAVAVPVVEWIGRRLTAMAMTLEGR
jgi:DNA (cytosine-5)-methyltransferase 1